MTDGILTKNMKKRPKKVIYEGHMFRMKMAAKKMCYLIVIIKIIMMIMMTITMKTDRILKDGVKTIILMTTTTLRVLLSLLMEIMLRSRALKLTFTT